MQNSTIEKPKSEDIEDQTGPHGASESPSATRKKPDLPQNPLLPDGSRKTVYRTLQVVRTAERNERFSGIRLKREHGIGQERQAMRLLRFLDLLDDHANLRAEVADCRGNLHLFAELLTRNVRRSSDAAGIPEELSRRLGSEGHEWTELRSQLCDAEPISSLTPNVRNNVVGSFRALDEVLQHVADEGWLDERARSLGSNPGPNAGSTKEMSEQAPYNIPFSADGEDLTASVVLKGRVRDRSAALKKLGELLAKMAGE